jgi:hypothetical protein
MVFRRKPQLTTPASAGVLFSGLFPQNDLMAKPIYFQCVLLLALLFPRQSFATIHCSEERYAPLPSSWAGFLADHRALRVASMPPSSKAPPSLLRLQYQARVEQVLALRKTRPLQALELADLGALYLRLGQTDAALDILRPAANQFPRDFAIQTNLGSAWQLAGNNALAVDHLRQAVKLAPPAMKTREELHLKLVLGRQRENKGLDNLFNIRFTTTEGQHRLGKLDANERAQLPQEMIALAQLLALSFPNDGKLLWELGELAALYGDLTTASQLLDLCVGESALADPALRRSRQALLAAADSANPVVPSQQQELHTAHNTGLKLEFRSRRPLIQQQFDVKKLENRIPGQPRQFKPQFHPFLQKLQNQPVTLTGFLHPLTDDLDCTSFLLVEHPIGCWYCTAPDLTGIVFVTMKSGTTARFSRDVLTVTGMLKLNHADPEEFLFTINDAQMLERK